MAFFVLGHGLFAAAVRDHVISRAGVMAWMRRTFAAGFLRSERSWRSRRGEVTGIALHAIVAKRGVI